MTCVFAETSGACRENGGNCTFSLPQKKIKVNIDYFDKDLLSYNIFSHLRLQSFTSIIKIKDRMANRNKSILKNTMQRNS